MSVKIRLQQTGSRNRRSFRIVAVDEHKKRDGAVIEYLGFVNPLVKPVKVEIEKERLTYWKQNGAQVSLAVEKLLHPGGKS